MLVKPWARSVGVPASTVFSAIQLGQIARAPDGLDVNAAEAWLRSRQDRFRQDHAAEVDRDRARQRELGALAAQAATEIAKLRRQIEELHWTTVASDTTAAARDRRQRRLEAALAAVPALHTAAVAEAVSRALAKLAARVARDLGELAGK